MRLGASLAALAGCAAGLVGPSTLHLLWDLVGLLAGDSCEFIADEECYPVSRWALERAVAAGSRVRWFRHHDPDSLWRALRHCRSRPVVVSDGFCPACGVGAPLAGYLEAVRRRSGWLVIDDTQALGIFGRRTGPSPYGSGGGGSPRFQGLEDPGLLVVASLAKAFGAPLACLLGPRSFIRKFENESETRVHCSPPPIATIEGGLEAMQWNRTRGDAVRARLLGLVRQFRSGAFAAGWRAAGGVFPMQSIEHPDALAIHRHLLARGIRTFARRPHAGEYPRVGLIINARHRPEDLAWVTRELHNIPSRRSANGKRAII